jgi:hypothetical protein
MQLEYMCGCKHPLIDWGLLPSGVLAAHPIENNSATSSKEVYVSIEYGFDILRLIKTLGGDIRNI